MLSFMQMTAAIAGPARADEGEETEGNKTDNGAGFDDDGVAKTDTDDVSELSEDLTGNEAKKIIESTENDQEIDNSSCSEAGKADTEQYSGDNESGDASNKAHEWFASNAAERFEHDKVSEVIQKQNSENGVSECTSVSKSNDSATIDKQVSGELSDVTASGNTANSQNCININTDGLEVLEVSINSSVDLENDSCLSIVDQTIEESVVVKSLHDELKEALDTVDGLKDESECEERSNSDESLTDNLTLSCYEIQSDQAVVEEILINEHVFKQELVRSSNLEAVSNTIVTLTSNTDQEVKNSTDLKSDSPVACATQHLITNPDSDAESVRATELKEAFIACVKDHKHEITSYNKTFTEDTNLANLSDTKANNDNENSQETHVKNSVGYSSLLSRYIENKTEISNMDIEVELADNITEGTSIPSEEDKNCKNIPEQREVEGCISPSLMFASCRYRWERTIFTQARSVVFVTINNKNIEPLSLEWSDSSKCYYSDETKMPVGVYVGNLVVDGTFYPIEDIIVKHYTFEVDLYLKDDLPESVNHEAPLNAENGTANQTQADIRYPIPYRNGHQSHAPVSTSFILRGTSMENTEALSESDSSIHHSSKYEELVRSQLTDKAPTPSNGSDSQTMLKLKSDLPDMDGRGTPVGEDSVKQYQDGETSVKSRDMGYSFGNADSGSRSNSALDDYLERQSLRSNDSLGHSSIARSDKVPSPVVDDVKPNGQVRSPVYNTDSPAYSRHSSAHSSAHNSARQTPTVLEGRDAGLGRPESVTSAHSSARQTPVNMDTYGRPDSAGSTHSSARQTPVTVDITRPDSVGSVHSGNSMSRHVLDDLLNDALGRNKTPVDSLEGSRPPSNLDSLDSNHSKASSSRQEINKLIHEAFAAPVKAESNQPSKTNTRSFSPEQIADVLNPADRHSPIRREFLTGSPHVPSNHSSARNTPQNTPQSGGSANSSQRQTPQRELISSNLRTSQDKLYSSQELGRLSGNESDGAASQPGSRPLSITSEQELSQYYDLTTDTHAQVPAESYVTGPADQRTLSASSLPAIGAAQRMTPDKRSMTPDNHIRVPVTGPIIKASLLPNRTPPPRTPLSNASSRTVTPVNAMSNASSRTVTPVNAQSDVDVKLREQVHDLEDIVSSQQKRLDSKEHQLTELKGQCEDVREVNRKLQTEIERLRSRASPAVPPPATESDSKLRDLTVECDTLRSEVLRLKDEVRRKQEPSLTSYNPNSPSTLQRKIDELNSQILDLQEANESAVAELQHSEHKVKELAMKNETMQITKSDKERLLDDENRQLKTELMRLKESQSVHSEASDYRYKIELQQLKEDNRSLRERNYQLHDDNMRCKDELSNLRKSFDLIDNVKKSAGFSERKSPRTSKSLDRKDEAYVERSSYGTEHNYSYHTSRRSDVDRRDRNVDQQISREIDRKFDQQIDMQLNQQLSREIDHQIDREIDRQIDRDINRQIEQTLSRHLDRGEGSYINARETSEPYETRAAEKTPDKFVMKDSLRYRSGPDGRSDDRYRSALGYPPPISSSDRPSTSGPRSLDTSELEPSQRDRSSDRARTRSMEQDVMFSAYNGDLSKTTPELSGRSRAIYKEICSKRAQSGPSGSPTSAATQVEVNAQKPPIVKPCEWPETLSNLDYTDQQYNLTNESHTVPTVSSATVPPVSSATAPPVSSATMHVSSESTHVSPTVNHNMPAHTDDKDIDVDRHRPSATIHRTRKSDREHLLYEPRPAHPQPVTTTGYHDDGNTSDTPTDVLCSAAPIDRLPASSWSRTRRRHGSIGSDGSNDSLEDIEDQLTASAKRRSKSADGREILRTLGAIPGVGKGETTLSRTLSPAPSRGLRSITPIPLTTQHNKGQLSLSSSLNSLTQGLRPFAPRSAGDLRCNDVIKFSRQGGKLSQGTIKFIGHLPGRGDIYLGVELDKEDGKHDGVFEGIRYFRSKNSKGVFVAYNKVVMAWTSL